MMMLLFSFWFAGIDGIAQFITKPTNTQFTIPSSGGGTTASSPKFSCEIDFETSGDELEWYAYGAGGVETLISRGSEVQDEYQQTYYVQVVGGEVTLNLQVGFITLQSPTKYECRSQFTPVITAAASVIIFGTYVRKLASECTGTCMR